MNKYINFGAMSPQQRQVFNKTGYADKECVMSKSEWEDMVEAVVQKESLGNIVEEVV
jgi:hypothetical protein